MLIHVYTVFNHYDVYYKVENGCRLISNETLKQNLWYILAYG